MLGLTCHYHLSFLRRSVAKVWWDSHVRCGKEWHFENESNKLWFQSNELLLFWLLFNRVHDKLPTDIWQSTSDVMKINFLEIGIMCNTCTQEKSWTMVFKLGLHFLYLTRTAMRVVNLPHLPLISTLSWSGFQS